MLQDGGHLDIGLDGSRIEGAIPPVVPQPIFAIRKRAGSRVTKEDLDRATYIRLITREKHMNENEDRRIEVVKANFFNHDYI